MRRKLYQSVITIPLISGLVLTPYVCAAPPPETKFIFPEYSKKISMDFKGAQLNDVLKMFSQQSGLNFIAAQDIANKQVTLYLDEVPVEEALERILRANNLTYEIDQGSNIFVVKTVKKPETELITRIYPLKYATVSSSKLRKTIDITAVGGAAAGAGEKEGIVSAMKSIISSSGSIVEDARTNSLIITDIPIQFPIIEDTLAKLDVAIAQILIEVEMLDISKTTSEKLGMKYGETPFAFTGGARDHVYPWNQNNLLRKGRFTFDDSEFRVGTIDASGLSATLQFLKTQTDTKNLARPRILTLNNETAEIKIATNEAIGEASKTTSSEGSAQTTATAERVETGVFLTVTPQVNPATNEITMAIAPKVIQARSGIQIRGTTFKDPEERGTKSILTVKSGETIILGGLLRTDGTKTMTKLPFLGDLPFIGGAFRHKDGEEKERELIIFITPHIISNRQKELVDASIAETPRLTREQDIPPHRLNEIDKALAIFEKEKM